MSPRCNNGRSAIRADHGQSGSDDNVEKADAEQEAEIDQSAVQAALEKLKKM
jgi:hypothetical protein